MPTATYIPLGTTTLATTATSITFSSIPATYRDLVLVVNGQFTANTGLGIRFNGDTGSNYSVQVLDNNGSTPRAGVDSPITSFYGSWSATTSGTRYNNELHLFDYSASDRQKQVLYRNGYTDNGGTSRVSLFSGKWANNSAVTSITLFATSMASGFTFSLYGIAS